jgi:hypothetical protein
MASKMVITSTLATRSRTVEYSDGYALLPEPNAVDFNNPILKRNGKNRRNTEIGLTLGEPPKGCGRDIAGHMRGHLFRQFSQLCVSHLLGPVLFPLVPGEQPHHSS